jgi:hypothetical protein
MTSLSLKCQDRGDYYSAEEFGDPKPSSGMRARKARCADRSTGHTTLCGAEVSAAMMFFEIGAEARFDNLTGRHAILHRPPEEIHSPILSKKDIAAKPLRNLMDVLPWFE